MKYGISIFLLVLLTQCEWLKKREVAPQLPPVTQTGANTFGCKINDQIFIPKSCGIGFTPLQADLDLTLPNSKGRFAVTGYFCQGQGRYESVSIVIDSARADTEYRYQPWDGKKLLVFSFAYASPKDKCSISSVDKDTGYESSIFCSGRATITRLDQQKGIVAGTFEFDLYKPGCDTIRVTDGRFDIKM